MKKHFIFLLGVVLTVTPVCAQRSAQSKVETKSLFSKVLNAERDYTIYLPKSYGTDTDRKYPILYLLHGMTDNSTQWYNRGHLKDVMDLLTASGEACEMIVVTPCAGGSIESGAWNGYFDMPGWKYETFFFTEFLPYIESAYRVIGNKQTRAVAGLSMGGGGSASYAQKHPELFSSVYAMSALMNIPAERAVPDKSAKDKRALLYLSVIENNCIAFVDKAGDALRDQLRSVAWFVDCGDDDYLLDRNIEFTQAMRRAGIPCEFRIRNGGHGWEYWNQALYICLPFVTRNFK
ncbi:MAG: esterase family protein [Mediterranea sp.]|jgi:S-formylglutathione hydrolase FrmB|nr:esterase family protein [Mediterranea sp.]